ncbi:LysM peptidoglycan-binding domain-containing protein [Chloroflexota bacterium]|nr:LysM peptidoglycan-binding domain-containing protein [Chloroflexota bacterium]
MKKVLGIFLLMAVFLTGCYRPGPGAKVWQASSSEGSTSTEGMFIYATETPSPTEMAATSNAYATPTSNNPITLPTLRSEVAYYTVQAGDTLAKIAGRYQVSVNQILRENTIANPDIIEVGINLLIPIPSFDLLASPFKIIPDSELVYSPGNAAFDVDAFVSSRNGYLASYYQTLDGVVTSGAGVVSRVATEYSVNPRLLLAVLEYQSGWVTEATPASETMVYPMRVYEEYREGLYSQLSLAASLLNEGFYKWGIETISIWTLTDSTVVEVDPTINAGTAGVLNLMSNLTTAATWDQATSEAGIYQTYVSLFGNPFSYAVDPLLPENLTQPTLQLPFEVGDVWAYTSGPHSGWDAGSAWAALDFAPPDDVGCYASAFWVAAVAPGEVVYTGNGVVVQELAGDGIWQDGWSILYMHVSSWERVEVGTYLEAGDRVGHASCEGGVSTGAHLHIARRYNGVWIAADGDLPFVMDGWVSAGYGVEYNGSLIKGARIVEAWDGRSAFNAIQR